MSELPTKEESVATRIQDICQRGFETALPHLIDLATGVVPDTNPTTHVRALATLGKYAVTSQREIVLEQPHWLRIIVKVTKRHMQQDGEFDRWWSEVTAEIEEFAALLHGVEPTTIQT